MENYETRFTWDADVDGILFSYSIVELLVLVTWFSSNEFIDP